MRVIAFLVTLLSLSYGHCTGTVYVLYHRPFWTYESSVFQPMQVGKKGSSMALDMLGDDTGDNISQKNSLYAEMTACYWAWKNRPPGEFVGFFHYRRWLDTSLQDCEPNQWYQNAIGRTSQPELLRAPSKAPFIDEQNLCDLMHQYDVIVPYKHSFAEYSLTEQFCKVHQWWEDLMHVLFKMFPEHRHLIEKTFNEMHEGYMQNRFIMRDALFQEYADWIFSIFFEMEKIIPERGDHTHFPSFKIFGYMGERLLNLFLEIKKVESNIKIKELPTILIEDVEGQNALVLRNCSQ